MTKRDVQFVSRSPLLSLHAQAPPDTTPHLNHLADFQKALASYRISAEAVSVLQTTPIMLMTSVTSSGRNTIINELVKTGRYHFIPSDTTRPPRNNNGTWEQDGVEYFFRPEAEVLADIKAGNYIAPTVFASQQASGINIEQLKEAAGQGKIPITDVEIAGAGAVLAVAPRTVVVFPLPPSFDEWLARIRRRSSFTPGELSRRLTTAVQEIKLALSCPDITFIVNDRLYDAVGAVDSLARGVHHRRAERLARQRAQTLCDETRAYLRQQFNINV